RGGIVLERENDFRSGFGFQSCLAEDHRFLVFRGTGAQFDFRRTGQGDGGGEKKGGSQNVQEAVHEELLRGYREFIERVSLDFIPAVGWMQWLWNESFFMTEFVGFVME